MSKCSLMILYKTFVRPHLEYILCPNLNSHYYKDIERVQRRATATSTFSYESRLNHLQLHSLYCRRQRRNLIEAYKIINNHYHINSDIIFTKLSGSTTRGHTRPRLISMLAQLIFEHNRYLKA